jgi:hypothetical protein
MAILKAGGLRFAASLSHSYDHPRERESERERDGGRANGISDHFALVFTLCNICRSSGPGFGN